MSKEKKIPCKIIIINKIKEKHVYTSENSFLMTAKKVPNSDSSVVAASRQFMIRWTETTRPKKKKQVTFEQFVHYCIY